jgi:hypothetical protein
MATSPSLGAIVGLDGVNPIYNPSSTWKIWNINEIYRGQNATGKYIPNVSHMVYEIIGARVYRYIVKSINWENGVAELIREQSDNQSGMFNETDILIGLDTSVTLTKQHHLTESQLTNAALSPEAWSPSANCSRGTCSPMTVKLSPESMTPVVDFPGKTSPWKLQVPSKYRMLQWWKIEPSKRSGPHTPPLTSKPVNS